MTFDIEKMLDETGWQLLQAIQENARLSYSELGQRVNLSAPAVADRIRKLEESGIISGYHAQVNTSKLGLPVTAIIRLSSVTGQSCQIIARNVSEIPEVLECYRVTGSDAVVTKVVATSVNHLEWIIDQMITYGSPTTSLVLSQPTLRTTITRTMVERGEEIERS